MVSLNFVEVDSFDPAQSSSVHPISLMMEPAKHLNTTPQWGHEVLAEKMELRTKVVHHVEVLACSFVERNW